MEVWKYTYSDNDGFSRAWTQLALYVYFISVGAIVTLQRKIKQIYLMKHGFFSKILGGFIDWLPAVGNDNSEIEDINFYRPSYDLAEDED